MEILSSLIELVVSKIGDPLIESVVGQCKHLIHPDQSINNLTEERDQLNDIKEALQVKVDADKRNGLQIAPEVEKWLHEVEDFQTKLRRFYEDEVNDNNQRCRRWRRYSLSMKAAKRIATIISLKDNRQKFQIISNPPTPSRVGKMFTANVKSFQSRTKIISEIIKDLKSDEFKRISICGMGGVGKTTMVKEVMKIAEANKQFDEVAFATVSQSVDYWKVQGDIAGMLDLTLKKETLQGRASEILDRLKSVNKVLIVLDDIWNKLDFEQIGLPSGTEDHRGCKFLFTSRYEHVCDEMGSQKNFVIPTLSSDEAWDLFKEMAGTEICNTYDIHPIAKEVANECSGLPIAIVTVARALVNKKKHTWEDILDKLKNSPITTFLEIQKYVYSRIQLSYDFLDSEEHKDCLLLCCLFPKILTSP